MLLEVWGGEGWRGFVAGWKRQGTLSLSLSLPTYLAALKEVMESGERRIHHYHHHHHGV